MILAEWSCELPQDLLEDFFKFAQSKLKPFYMSNGAKDYALFMSVEKRYFPYQLKARKTRYFEQILFSKIEDFERFFKKAETDPSAREMVASYEKKFHVKSLRFRILLQKV